MHLLNARAATPDDAGEAVDLAQSPGDIVFLSAADTELACLAAAQARRPADAPSLRLANLLQLGHPMSVDLYVEQVISRARLVILRLLGGRSYWPYGLEQVAGACRAGGIPLYVEEFVRAVADRAPAAAGAREKQIPATLRDSLMSRLDALGRGRSVALQASVLGRHFLYRDLRALMELDERELAVALHALTSAGILLQTGVIPDASFEFKHALLRDIAYQTLLRSDRERLHRRFAELASAGVIGEMGHLPELLAAFPEPA